MGTRIIFGIIGAIILLGSLLWNQTSWTVFIGLLAIVGMKELLAMINVKTASPLNLLSAVTVVSVLSGFVDVYVIILVVVFGLVLLSLYKQEETNITHVTMFLFGLGYILLGFCSSLSVYENEGKLFLLFLIILIWASDSFAYFAGYFFGKHKMAPVLSPKKTYEGLIGGIIGTLLLSYFLNGWFDLGLTTFVSIGLGAFVAVIAPIGDLFESSIKRHYGVKDSGNILPGHGGVLDRFDSFLFVMIFYHLFQVLFI